MVDQERISAQTPAEGILKTHEWGSSKMYKVVCGCGQPDHSHDIDIEADDTGVNVNIYVTLKADFWQETLKKRYDIDNIWLQEFDWAWKNLANGFINRVKLTWTLWIKGYVKTETTIAMTEQQALNYAETLKSAIRDVKNFKKS